MTFGPPASVSPGCPLGASSCNVLRLILWVLAAFLPSKVEHRWIMLSLSSSCCLCLAFCQAAVVSRTAEDILSLRPSAEEGTTARTEVSAGAFVALSGCSAGAAVAVAARALALSGCSGTAAVVAAIVGCMAVSVEALPLLSRCSADDAVATAVVAAVGACLASASPLSP